MKKIIAGALVAAFSFSAQAAEMMLQKDFEKVADQYVNVGEIATSGTTSTAEAKAELSKKADEKGGDIFVMTSGNTNNKIHGTANVYRKR
ncbi:DUF1471 family periplasmic protein YahO [Citrobacter sp. R56]|uniref:DUF1471 family periplasmic protein YahO n=1 Tax=Citrobacter sp. R56 TaxID=1573676 RepID=UPI001079B5F4|nr:DUF1471 family periplasmic protein YahO [Citrobacter sp. R56]QRG78787.1 DUF1471 domain-containing protein [Citrobacter sp. R56]